MFEKKKSPDKLSENPGPGENKIAGWPHLCLKFYLHKTLACQILVVIVARKRGLGMHTNFSDFPALGIHVRNRFQKNIHARGDGSIDADRTWKQV
jgi:hypothetical protein